MSGMDLEAKRQLITRVATVGFVGVVCAATASYAWLALEGLMAWGAFGISLVVGWSLAPAFSTWVANKRIQALEAVIEANPIETMKNLYADKAQELAEADKNIRDFDMEVRNFDDQVTGFKRQYPEEAQSYVDLSQKMHDGLTNMRAQQAEARKELTNFQMQIDKAEAIYKMANAANKVTSMSQSAQQQVFSDIKKKVAFDAVRSNLNRAFANLDVALERRNATTVAVVPPKQLSEGAAPTDARPVVQPQSVKVTR